MLKNTQRNRDIDFLLAYKNSEKKPSKVQHHMKYIIPPVCVVLLFGGGFGFLKIQESNIKKEIKNIKEEISAFDKNKQDNKTDEKYKTLQDNKTLLASIQEEATKMNSYPQLSKQVVDVVLKITTTLDLKTMNYDQQSGELNLTVETKNVSQTNVFVAALKNAGVFADVKYSGYSENKQGATSSLDPVTGTVQENNTNATTTYVVTVICILKEGV